MRERNDGARRKSEKAEGTAKREGRAGKQKEEWHKNVV